MNILISILISLLFSFLPLFHIRKNKSSDKYYLICFIILFIGCFFRLYLIDKYPVGLNQDEASIGYEAYSLLQNGIDRNGMSYPVNFISWGSGQNVLYAYLSIPFIKLFGLNVLSTRILMALVGCFTLLVIYLFSSKHLKKSYSLILLFIFSIIPWHLMKSRWGLESNIFPDLILYSLMLVYLGAETLKKRYYIFSAIILGISTYSYGTSYLFVPLLSILLYFKLIQKKKMKIIDVVLYLFIIGFISFPMILYVIVNQFNLNTIHIGPITIPKLYINRAQSVTLLSGNNFLINFFSVIIFLIFQSDVISYNCIPYFGIYYFISFPFLLYGIYKSFKSKHIIFTIINTEFIASIIMGFFVHSNINRINVLWIAVICYIVYGIVLAIEKHNRFKLIIPVYIISFILFITYYFNGYSNSLLKNSTYSLDQSLVYVNTLDYKELYITAKINQPYIYYLFYNKVDSKYYIKNRNIEEYNVMFQNVSQIGNVHFETPKSVSHGMVIISSNSENKDYPCDSKRFKNYTVYVC